jgi:LacI family transcriptional regulator
MKDVAKEAGVALGTVSKVINNQAVGDEYRIKVEQAIEKLNYKVNVYARGLKSQSTKTIALILPDLISPFFSQLAYYVELNLFSKGYKTLLCCSQGKKEKETYYINMSHQNKVDGIIALTYSNINDLISPDLPFVSIDRHFDKNVQCVASDNFNGGFIATEKLISCGCKRPAYIRTGSIYYGETNKRKLGYFDACEKYGITPITLELNDSDNTLECFAQFIEKHTDANGRLYIDGFFTVSDRLGLEIKNHLESIGYHIPRDIQVIGFDGIRQFGDMDYYLSTIKQPIEDIASACVEILLSKDRHLYANPYILPVSYQYGGTTNE